MARETVAAYLRGAAGFGVLGFVIGGLVAGLGAISGREMEATGVIVGAAAGLVLVSWSRQGR